MYQAAQAATKALFDHHMNEVEKLNPKAFIELNKREHNTWANYACRKNVIWEQSTSNMAESTNALVGEEVQMAVVCLLGILEAVTTPCTLDRRLFYVDTDTGYVIRWEALVHVGVSSYHLFGF